MHREGSWWTHSQEDPRFDLEGRGLVGGFSPPLEARHAIAAKERELGCKAPDDLEFGYVKD